MPDPANDPDESILCASCNQDEINMLFHSESIENQSLFAAQLDNLQGLLIGLHQLNFKQCTGADIM